MVAICFLCVYAHIGVSWFIDLSHYIYVCIYVYMYVSMNVDSYNVYAHVYAYVHVTCTCVFVESSAPRAVSAPY